MNSNGKSEFSGRSYQDERRAQIRQRKAWINSLRKAANARRGR